MFLTNRFNFSRVQLITCCWNVFLFVYLEARTAHGQLVCFALRNTCSLHVWDTSWSNLTLSIFQDLVSPRIVKQIQAPSSSPSVARFLQNESRCSEYESETETKYTKWSTDESLIKSVTPSLTNLDRQVKPSAEVPLAPSQFEIPLRIEGPSRPKFEPISPAPTSTRVKRDEVRTTSQTVFRPKAVKQATPDFNLKPGSPPEMAFAPSYPKALETSNIMSYKESTETSQRSVNVQQTTRVISFGKDRVKGSRPPVTKFPAKLNVESDYESDMEGFRFPPEGKSAPQQPRCTSAPLSARQPRPHELQVANDINLTPGEPPQFIFAPIQTATNCKYHFYHYSAILTIRQTQLVVSRKLTLYMYNIWFQEFIYIIRLIISRCQPPHARYVTFV